jgi:hypothetical protein
METSDMNPFYRWVIVGVGALMTCVAILFPSWHDPAFACKALCDGSADRSSHPIDERTLVPEPTP